MANKGLGRGFASLMGLNDIDDFTQPSQTVPAENIETPNTNDGVVNISLLDIDPNSAKASSSKFLRGCS